MNTFTGRLCRGAVLFALCAAVACVFSCGGNFTDPGLDDMPGKNRKYPLGGGEGTSDTNSDGPESGGEDGTGGAEGGGTTPDGPVPGGGDDGTAAPDDATITVTVSPAMANVAQGETKQFTADVTGAGVFDHSVVWTVEEADKMSGTGITGGGWLTVARNEALTTLHIRATSVTDKSKYGAATVTVPPYTGLESGQFNSVAGNNTLTITLTGGTFTASAPALSYFTISTPGTGGFFAGLEGGTVNRESDTVVTITGLTPVETAGSGQKITIAAAAMETRATGAVVAASTLITVIDLSSPSAGDVTTTMWDYSDGVYTIKDGAEVTVIKATTDGRLVVSGTATVTLDGASINLSGGTAGAPFDLEDGANVTLLLKGENTLISGSDGSAGLHAPEGTTLVIDSAFSTNAGTENSSHSGSGSLTAAGGGNGAGIGGGSGCAGGNITISGGTITSARGGSGGAGIGGGSGSAGGTITVSGGTITSAAGGTSAAGIGGGSGGAGGTITVSGGSVNAKGGGIYGDKGGTGIGGGYNGATGRITISGGEVTARGNSDTNGSGIGGYTAAPDDAIVISGGTVDAMCGDGPARGAGIRGGGAPITISGGVVTAAGSRNWGSGINGGSGTVNITGGEVTARGGGVEGHGLTSAFVMISGGTVNAAAYYNGAGISCEPGGTVTITGGHITATGGSCSAGIGGTAWSGWSGTLRINCPEDGGPGDSHGSALGDNKYSSIGRGSGSFVYNGTETDWSTLPNPFTWPVPAPPGPVNAD